VTNAGPAVGANGHVTVVGAGAVGVCCALYLQREGFGVKLVERGGIAGEASQSNAGLISADDCVPIGTPGVLRKVPGMLLDPLEPLTIRWRYLPRLSPWLLEFIRASRRQRVEEISVALMSLLRLAVDAYLALLTDDEARRFITRSGLLYAYRTDGAFEADQFGIELRRRRGVALEVLDGGAVGRLEPALTGKCRHGVFCPDTAFTANPGALVRTLADRFIEAGGEIVHAEVLQLKVKDREPVALATTDGLHAIDRLVIAAGAWSRPLAVELGARVPLDTERGYIIVLPDVARKPRIPFLAVDRHVAVTPMETGLRIAGTVEFAGLRAGPNLRRADALLESVSPFLGPLDGLDAMRWMSFRPSMPDSIPVIGWAPGRSRAFLAFGHGHLGLSLAAVTGKLTAEAMAGRQPSVDITPFRPERWLKNGSLPQTAV
jgi:D-amino-acid dehydrogenase